MEQVELFSILDIVDSTNNYAMAKVHAGLAKHGNAWFAHHQKSGKGQLGKQWQSNPRENILMSIVIEPDIVYYGKPFFFNAAVANICHHFFKIYAGNEVSIKWPNDIYWRDRKAGGILIENIYQKKKWKWAVVGIGININQVAFDPSFPNPVSLKQVTGKSFDPILLARELYKLIMVSINAKTPGTMKDILIQYNSNLYMRYREVQLRKGNVVFTTMVKEVDHQGQLKTEDAIERSFSFGEAEWLISK